ncbi:hypothetical protein [Miniphocaeibacter massiliensis]|uniref:hypothetical protein n=1 Tax=Miniphocaeibacter massiliensis TaxID=2041841 RepID=UPI00101AE7A5|nr:hypothetical protein [Miniphocaeibacter massiliensis]
MSISLLLVILSVILIKKFYSDSNKRNDEKPLKKIELRKPIKISSTAHLNYKLNMVEKFKQSSPFENAKSYLKIPTYIGNNQLLHPSVFYNPSKKFGYKWVMAFTPYSYTNDSTENPSIVVSEDGINWNVPNGLTNPLAKTNRPGVVHYSDTEIFSNGNELELWYRESDKQARQSRILRRKSNDLVNWSDPEVVFDYGTGGYGYGAPSVNYEDGIYEIYYRDHMSFGTEGYVKIKYSGNNIIEEKKAVDFQYTEEYKDYVAWHTEFKKIGSKYYALAMSYNKDIPGKGLLFLFESDDGISFKDMKMLVKPSDTGFDNSTIYKSSMVIDNDFINLYYSSISTKKECYTSLIRIDR